MTDYKKSTGSSGTMMIRDTAGKIQFWLQAGSATYNHDLQWGYTVNGVTDNSNSFDFESGGDWQKLREWTVSSSQTVTFRLEATGTSGLGGPTTLSASINRATVPPAPTTPKITNVTSTSFMTNIDSNGDGGDPIIEHQMGYGTGSSSPSMFKDVAVGGGGVTTITGLARDTLYYVWARSRNSEGWSAWSGRASARTLSYPDAPSKVTLSNITQVSVVASFALNANNGAAITSNQVGWSTNSTAPTSSVTITSTSTTITGLQPGTTYYFWARSHNSIGWSPYSAVSSATLIAGAWVKVGAVWKRAVPYVRVAGVWKVARPWGRTSGVWREST